MRAYNIGVIPSYRTSIRIGSQPAKPALEKEASYANADNQNTFRSRDEETRHRYPQTPARAIKLFDPSSFLTQAGLGRKIVEFKKGQTIFSQGDPAETVFYIQSGQSSSR